MSLLARVSAASSFLQNFSVRCGRPPAASAAGQLLAAHPVAASASALGALLAIGAACSYVALSRRLAKLSELDEAAEALDPEYF